MKKFTFNKTICAIIVMALLPNPVYAWKLKFLGIKACHDCANGPNLNIDKAATKAYQSSLSIAKSGVDSAEYLLKAQLAGLGSVINIVEMGAHELKGDSDGAKKALSRSKKNIHESAKLAGKGIDKSFETAMMTVKAPYFLQAQMLDDTFRTGGNYTLFVTKTSKKVGIVLKISAEPKNLGKVALVTGASTLGGPLGAAFANALYDKIVLKKSMSDKDLLKSIAIGAAAGYAAEVSSAQMALNAPTASRAIVNAVKGISQNLVQDTGNIVLNKQEYDFRKFMASVLTGATQIDVNVDNNLLSQAINSSLNAAVDSATVQAVETDLKKINMGEVSDSLLYGFSNGLTHAAVADFVETALNKALPLDFERLDKQAFDQITYALTRVLSITHEMDVVANQAEVYKWFKNLSEDQQKQYVSNIDAGRIAVVEALAQKLYNKSFDSLTDAQKDSDLFLGEYQKVFGEFALEEAKRFKTSDPQQRSVTQAIGRSPASLMGAITSIFGFGAAIGTASDIADIRLDLLDKYDVHAHLKGVRQQEKIYQALAKLERLGIIYLKDVAAEEGIDLLKQYYSLQTQGPSMDIEGLSNKNAQALIKMSVKNIKAFNKKVEEVKDRDEFFMALAQEIKEEAVGPGPN